MNIGGTCCSFRSEKAHNSLPMDVHATKLLSRAQNNLKNIPKLLLLPSVFFLYAVIFMPDQPMINPFNLINSLSYLTSSANSTSVEATAINETTSSSGLNSSSFPSLCSANVSSEVCSSDLSVATSTTADANASRDYPQPSSHSSSHKTINADPPTIPTVEAIGSSIDSGTSHLNSSSLRPSTGAASAAPMAAANASTSREYLNASSQSSFKPSKDASRGAISNAKPASVGVARNCDIFKGEWVPDPEAPYYTNMTCSMIQEHQNCMKYGRPDMDFLKWRWKPEGCELPRFDPVHFLELVRGKSMAFVGDSLARNHMQSLLCLLSRVELPEDVAVPDERIKRLYYANYKFTITIFWSPFLVRAQEMEKNGLWYVHLDKVDNNWATRIAEFDYLIISDSNWFTRPSMYFIKSQLNGCNYCQSKKIATRSLYYANKLAFRTVFQAINRVARYKGLTIFRTVSPSHFENGPWNQGGNCNRTRPLKSKETRFQGSELEMYKAQLEVFKEARIEGRKMRREFKLMDMTNSMLLRPDGHPDRYGHWPHEYLTAHNDCVHWCLPGPVDSWNEFLIQMLM